MQCLSPQAKQAMARIFNLVNMSELPALSENVHELLEMLGNKNATARHLSSIILKDISLTSKVLQVVNSAYYTRGTQVSSISRAVTLIGFNTIRELALSIALFENFTQAGGDKSMVGNILTKSYLGGSLAKDVSKNYKLRVSPEEAFICGLFHNLGELIVLIYLPDLFRQIEKKRCPDWDKHSAAREVLGDLTFYQVGMEVAMFWNLCEKIIFSMHPAPPDVRHPGDDLALLMNLSAFCNQFIEQVNEDGKQMDLLFQHYGRILRVNRDKKKIFRLLEHIIDSAGNISEIIRSGLRRMRLHSKLIVVARTGKDDYVRIS